MSGMERRRLFTSVGLVARNVRHAAARIVPPFLELRWKAWACHPQIPRVNVIGELFVLLEVKEFCQSPAVHHHALSKAFRRRSSSFETVCTRASEARNIHHS